MSIKKSFSFSVIHNEDQDYRNCKKSPVTIVFHIKPMIETVLRLSDRTTLILCALLNQTTNIYM